MSRHPPGRTPLGYQRVVELLHQRLGRPLELAETADSSVGWIVGDVLVEVSCHLVPSSVVQVAVSTVIDRPDATPVTN